jgi:hypothetical protein
MKLDQRKKNRLLFFKRKAKNVLLLEIEKKFYYKLLNYIKLLGFNLMISDIRVNFSFTGYSDNSDTFPILEKKKGYRIFPI